MCLHDGRRILLATRIVVRDRKEEPTQNGPCRSAAKGKAGPNNGRKHAVRFLPVG